MDETILESLRRALLTRAPLDTIPAGVWRRAGALNTWGTNAIEGNTLNRRDVERILLERRSGPNHPLHDVLDTVQHARAFEDLPTRKGMTIRLSSIAELTEACYR